MNKKLDLQPLFPPDATEAERADFTKIIGYLRDEDFGNESIEKPDLPTRCAVRVYMQNDKGEFCFVKSMAVGFMIAPGGGVDPGENLHEAVRREVKEETGWTITNIRPVGYFHEFKSRIKHTTTFVFTANPVKHGKTYLMDNEKEAQMTETWMTLDDALAYQKSRKLIESQSYIGAFLRSREQKILEYFLDNKIAEDKERYPSK